MARWSRLADEAAALPAEEARRHRARAAALRKELDRMIVEADRRMSSAAEGPAVPRPAGADWAWRPDPWNAPLRVPGIAPVPERAEIAGGVTLHHDAPGSGVTLRQLRAMHADARAPYALQIDALTFGGSFLSLAVELPPSALSGLRNRHLVQVAGLIEMERPVEAFARLNVRHGPNVEQVVRSFDPGRLEVEFDLAHTKMNERRVEAMWLDVIFDAPAMNRIVVSDLTLCRRPRAEV